MKYLGIVIVVLVMAGGINFYLMNNDSASNTELQGARETVFEKPYKPDVAAKPYHLAVKQQPPAVEALSVTAEQRAAVKLQEEKLLSMAREYEDVRSDPEKRQQHRAQMKQQLASYSEEVLPVVLEKIKTAQAAN